VFEPFFTTKASHRGLGLTWVYGIITNHRGGVTVSSQPRQGACVRVYLPAERRVIKELGAGADELGGNQTILMVDDEESLLVLGQAILSSYGYRVLTANNGATALDLLAAHRDEIRLVITDLVMPQMSGRELIDKIKAVAPRLPVLCASGYVHPRREHQDSYLPKPFTAQELLWRVKQMLEESK
jgi:CheY-like chemotaxis protein